MNAEMRMSKLSSHRAGTRKIREWKVCIANFVEFSFGKYFLYGKWI